VFQRRLHQFCGTSGKFNIFHYFSQNKRNSEFTQCKKVRNKFRFYRRQSREVCIITGVFGNDGSNDVTAIFVTWREVTTPTKSSKSSTFKGIQDNPSSNLLNCSPGWLRRTVSFGDSQFHTSAAFTTMSVSHVILTFKLIWTLVWPNPNSDLA